LFEYYLIRLNANYNIIGFLLEERGAKVYLCFVLVSVCVCAKVRHWEQISPNSVSQKVIGEGQT